MSDGLRLNERQVFLLRACKLNYDEDFTYLNPPWFTQDRRECKSLKAMLLMVGGGAVGYRLTGLGEDVVRELSRRDMEWLQKEVECPSGTTPFR